MSTDQPTMKAIRQHEYGGGEVLQYEDAPRPELQPGDVLIKVHAAGINPVDWKVRDGGFGDAMSFPLILGWDVAGTIEEITDAVVGFEVGDAVYSRPEISRDGAYAEYIAVQANEVAPKPTSLDFAEAAGVPLAALTAWHALFEEADLQPGQRVLIHAAAGGVGHFAVQFARWRGAHVIGTASAPQHERLRELGADEVIDYRETAFEDAVSDIDVVLDTIGGDTAERSFQVLKAGGHIVSTVGEPSEELAAEHEVGASAFMVQPSAENLRTIGDLIDDGEVQVEIADILALEDAAKAHEISAEGHVHGKIVLEVVESV